MKEALRQIEEALKENCHRCDWVNLSSVKALQALSSLRSLLGSDAGKDEKELAAFIILYKNFTLNPSRNIWEKAESALSRLSAKAKLGEAEIREAKREAWDFAIFRIKNRPQLRRSYGDPQEPPEWESMESEEFATAMQVAVEIIEQLRDEQLAAPKEAGK